MESAMLLSLLGPMMMLVGLGLVLNGKNLMQGMQKEILSNTSMMWFFGVLSALLGLSMLRVHDSWDGGPNIIATVIGWAALVKGVIMLLFPKIMMNMASCKCWQGAGVYRFAGLLYLVLGFWVANEYYGLV
jgi:hypothetical protein